MKRVLSGTSWGSYRERNQKSPTVVTWGHYGGMSIRSAILDKRNGSSPSWSLNFHHFATPWAPRGSLTGGHVKVMLAYGHSLSHDHQGFRPFSPDHREAAGPVGPAVARVQVHCDHQTVPSRALTTASTRRPSQVGGAGDLTQITVISHIPGYHKSAWISHVAASQ